MVHLPRFIPAVLGLAILFSAVSCTTMREVRDIQCTLRFENVGLEVDQKQIDHAIRFHAEDVEREGTGTFFTYRFVVPDLETLKLIHSKIAYHEDTQIFNALNPAFTADYTTTLISASMEVIVEFRVTPGSQLFYKAPSKLEENISDLVSHSGHVRLKTKINPGQKYIYARSVRGEVERFIRINVHTQKVEDIARKDYP